MLRYPSQLNRSDTEARVPPGLLSPKRWIDLALDLIYPPRCAGCGRVDTDWCRHCRRDLLTAPLLLDPFDAPAPLTALAATGVHNGVLQRAVQALKYEGVTSLSSLLAQRLVARLDGLNWTFDTIVPVPLGTGRRRQRGYNQAQLLAEAVGVSLMIPCLPFALERRRDTRPQVGLNRPQRQQNMDDAFQGDNRALSGHSILIIDDVTTTGSTLQACAQAAKAAGASAIFGLTVTSAN